MTLTLSIVIIITLLSIVITFKIMSLKKFDTLTFHKHNLLGLLFYFLIGTALFAITFIFYKFALN
jgi:hypothetical protein